MWNSGVIVLPDRFPTKQGLKLPALLLYPLRGFLPDRFPTKQGLKLVCTYWKAYWSELPDRFPTKQGLKLQESFFFFKPEFPPRPISNKTRIETKISRRFERQQRSSQTDFQQNKDWNKRQKRWTIITQKLPDRFPTKQGLKRNYYRRPIGYGVLPDRFPTKQGLKLDQQEILDATSGAPRPISNKTRIETAMIARNRMMGNALPDRFPTKQGLKHASREEYIVNTTTPRPISNKTRIETYHLPPMALHWQPLPDRFPTKQGLKHNHNTRRHRSAYSQTDFQQNKDWNTYDATAWTTWSELPDRFPTKQGLKLVLVTIIDRRGSLPDRFPTKQGLKPINFSSISAASAAPRPISNKTRIETCHANNTSSRIVYSQTDFQQNKDWNQSILCYHD